MVPNDEHIIPHPHPQGGLVLAPVTIDELFFEPVQIYTCNGCITIQECLYGDGIDRILEEFSKIIQSNKNIEFKAGNKVKLYSFSPDNFEPLDA